MSETLQYLYLTTRGRKTGLPREIEIWFTTHGGKYYVIAETRLRANWVQNILHEPQLAFRVGQEQFHGTGRVLDDASEPEQAQLIRSLSEQKYGWSDGLIVELRPLPSPD